MRVKHRETAVEATVSGLNPAAVSPAEMIVWYDDGEADSVYVREWDPADPTLDHSALEKYLLERAGW